MTDYRKLSDRELDAMVAEKVCGWMHIKPSAAFPGRWAGNDPGLPSVRGFVPEYSASDDACRLALEALPEGKRDDFAISLQSGPWDDTIVEVWRAVIASPREKCLALLEALEAE